MLKMLRAVHMTRAIISSYTWFCLRVLLAYGVFLAIGWAVNQLDFPVMP